MPTPLVILVCQPASHPFAERHISLCEAAKVGRAVARSRASANNGIFDCKVLSRNHALLWYENNKFWLQDTRSSNGTFVNSGRLNSEPERESQPREIFSGDIIQFGVDVVEKTKKGDRVTHGCIIAQSTLIHPDGNEARRMSTIARMPAPSENAAARGQGQIYQLAHFLKEALHREQMLEKKINALRGMLENCQVASESGWQALLNEDKLLAKLELLESQLEVYAKAASDDTLKRQVVTALEERHTLEMTSKEMLTHMMEEKLVAVQKLDEVERHLSATQDECSHLRQQCEAVQEELMILSAKYKSQVEDVEGLQPTEGEDEIVSPKKEQLSVAETEHAAELQRCENEKIALQTKLDDVVREAEALTAQVEAIQADRDFSLEQLAAMKSSYDETMAAAASAHLSELRSQQEKESSMLASVLPNGHLDLSEPSSLIAPYPKPSDHSPYPIPPETATVKDTDAVEDTSCSSSPAIPAEGSSSSFNELEINLDDHLSTADSKLPTDDVSLGSASDQLRVAHERINYYQGLLAQSETRLNKSTQHVETLQTQLIQAHKDCVDHLQRIADLEDQLNVSETQINDMVDLTMADISTQLNECQRQTHNTCNLSRMLEQEIGWLEEELTRHMVNGKHEESDAVGEVDGGDIGAVAVSPTSPNSTAMLSRIRGLLCDVLANQRHTEATLRIYEGHLKNLRTSSTASTPEDDLDSATVVAGACVAGDPFDPPSEGTALRENAERPSDIGDGYRMEADDLRARLTEVETALKSKEERLRTWQHEQHERTRTEFESLRLECVQLRERIHNIEEVMQRSQVENVQLAKDYQALQQSYQELEACKARLEASTMENLTDAQKEADLSAEQLKEARCLVQTLKEKCAVQEAEVGTLRDLLGSMGNEYRGLANRSRVVSASAVIPVVILLFCTMISLFSALTSK